MLACLHTKLVWRRIVTCSNCQHVYSKMHCPLHSLPRWCKADAQWHTSAHLCAAPLRQESTTLQAVQLKATHSPGRPIAAYAGLACLRCRARGQLQYCSCARKMPGMWVALFYDTLLCKWQTLASCRSYKQKAACRAPKTSAGPNCKAERT